MVPGSSRAGIRGRFAGGWRVAVEAPPEKGRANDALEALLAEVLGLPRSAVAICVGHGQARKQVEIAGLDLAEVEERLAAAAASAAARRRPASD